MKEKDTKTWPRLRPATNKDSKKVMDMVFGILDEYGLEPDPDSTDTDLSDIRHFYFECGGTFYVLEDRDGSIIGSYGLYRLAPQTCELRKMYLAKTCRGRGLGKLLLDSALSKAKQLGYKTVILETASVLKEAITLYKSYGFREFHPEHLSPRCDQAFVLELE